MSCVLPTNADLLLDTAIALVQTTNENHAAVVKRAAGHTLGLAGHAAIEAYSVLTRLPGAQRVSAATALRIIQHNFPASHELSAVAAAGALERFRDAEIAGGAVYDGLVALAAQEAGIPMLTCDRRALVTYARLGVVVDVV